VEVLTVTFAKEEYFVPATDIIEEGIPVAATKRMMSRLNQVFGF